MLAFTATHEGYKRKNEQDDRRKFSKKAIHFILLRKAVAATQRSIFNESIRALLYFAANGAKAVAALILIAVWMEIVLDVTVFRYVAHSKLIFPNAT
jgi:hypothetical protein